MRPSSISCRHWPDSPRQRKPRSHGVEYLAAAGWQAPRWPVDNLFARNGIERTVVDDDAPFADVTYVNSTFTLGKHQERAHADPCRWLPMGEESGCAAG